MVMYRSGEGMLKMEVLSIDERKHYAFVVTIEGNEHYRFQGEDYSCPKSWSEEKIASDMFGWAIDFSCEEDDDLRDVVEFDQHYENEDIVIVEKV